MNIIKIISDPQLGEIVFKRNTKAKNYIIRLKNEKVNVTIPLYGTYTKANDFFSANRKKILHKLQQQSNQSNQVFQEIDESELRRKALIYLPTQLAELARFHGFKYSTVKIRKSKSRWGSCSTKGVINLSLYLMLLPEHLINYVLLHELCHTVQMNHSADFWDLMNKCTNNQAKELRREIRKYKNLNHSIDETNTNCRKQ